MYQILTSVGLHGVNRCADSILIQTLLNAYPFSEALTLLSVDGAVGAKTIARIKKFQSEALKITHPDGCVEPGGVTFDMLTVRVKPINDYHVSSQGVDLLKSIEKLACTPYDEKTGKTITNWVKGATIGYGHLITEDDWLKYKNGITPPQALELFDEDLIPYVNTVNEMVYACISQNEFDAMVMLSYNIGTYSFCSSSVLQLINDPYFETCYSDLNEAWKAWNRSQGRFNQSLMNRREAELDIYNNGVYHQW